MKLLGSYKSNLAPFHYEELVKLIEAAVELGEFSGNKTFDSDEVERLRQQASQFGELPIASAGQRVTDDSINNPLSLLRARYEALSREAGDFAARAALLISVLEKDTVLLEQLLAGASLESWAQLKTAITRAQRFQWDFAMGHGSVAADIPLQDPTSNVLYADRPPVGIFLNAATGDVHGGLVPPADVRRIGVKGLTWTYTAAGEKEELFGDDWARLSLLDPSPRISFTQDPHVDIILPRGAASAPFEITGLSDGSALPIYVRILLEPRRASTTLSVSDAITSDPVLNGSASNFLVAKPLDQIYLECYQSATAGADGTFKLRLALYDSAGTVINDITGSPWKVSLHSVTPALTPERYAGVIQIPDVAGVAKVKVEAVLTGNTTGTWTVNQYRAHLPQFLGTKDINADEVDIYETDRVYFLISDYVVDDSGQVTFKDVVDGKTLYVRFTELYPGYRCSVNEKDWSPLVMLDPAKPYPDDEQSFLPIELDGDKFPITDELGVPTGLLIRMASRPPGEYYLRVSNQASSARPGAEATLEIEFERPAYINAVALAPFTNFPLRLITMETQGLTADTRALVYEDETLINRPMSITFSRRLVRRVFLKVFQENYTIKEHTVDPPDKLRRDALAAIQSSLPYSVRQGQRAVVIRHRGFQYDFGLEALAGEDWTTTTPGVFVSGPYRFIGAPEVFKLDADLQGAPEIYLCFRAYDKTGVLQDVQLQGVSVTNGACVVFPFASSLDRTLVTNTDLYLKIVFRTASDILERFLLQASKL